jgi:hypothetical protein
LAAILKRQKSEISYMILRFFQNLFQAFWKSLAAIKKMHCSASKSSEKACCGVISQSSIKLQYFQKKATITSNSFDLQPLQPGCLGVKRRKEDMEAFVHFWRVMGFMLGIKDEYNICTDSLDTTIIRSFVRVQF